MNKGANWSKSRRKSKEIPSGRCVLFVCCGKCTEPNYFKAILEIINNHMLVKSQGITSFEYYVEPCPIDPLKMAKEVPFIIEKKAINPSEVYVVFDKDSFKKDNFNSAIDIVKNMNKDNCVYIPLWSNQCIELWFLLHYEYMHSQIDRSQYFKKLSKYLNEDYEKNTIDIVDKITKTGGKWDVAINNVKKLKDNYQNEKSFAEMDPCTNIDVFFEIYRDYLQ